MVERRGVGSFRQLSHPKAQTLKLSVSSGDVASVHTQAKKCDRQKYRGPPRRPNMHIRDSVHPQSHTRVCYFQFADPTGELTSEPIGNKKNKVVELVQPRGSGPTPLEPFSL